MGGGIELEEAGEAGVEEEVVSEVGAEASEDGWRGGWVGGWIEEKEAVGMRCWSLWVGGWVGGWVEDLRERVGSWAREVRGVRRSSSSSSSFSSPPFSPPLSFSLVGLGGRRGKVVLKEWASRRGLRRWVRRWRRAEETVLLSAVWGKRWVGGLGG